MIQLLFFILSLVGRLPIFILQGLSQLIYLIIRIIGYRRHIINRNLNLVFPEKSEDEKRQIRIDFYKIFADYFVEFFILLGAKKEKMVGQLVLMENEELLNEIKAEGKPVFLLAGHCFNWEWVGLLGTYFPQTHMFAVYKPLRNKQFNKQIEKLRFRLDGKGVATKELMHQIRTNEELDDSLYYLLVDQSPKMSEMKHFTKFFGHKTPIFAGYEILIRRTHGRAVFIYPQKLGLGKYIYQLSEIKPDGQTFEKDEIIQKFYAELEQKIKENPANWLWSHRRWKNLEN